MGSPDGNRPEAQATPPKEARPLLRHRSWRNRGLIANDGARWHASDAARARQHAIVAAVWLALVPLVIYMGIFRSWQVPAAFAAVHASIALLYRRRAKLSSGRPAP